MGEKKDLMRERENIGIAGMLIFVTFVAIVSYLTSHSLDYMLSAMLYALTGMVAILIILIYIRDKEKKKTE